jgi:Tfp pilus assembly PilM family ATPase/Tfp pilus assembly protein PilN
MAQIVLKPGFKKPTVVVEIGNDWLKILEYNPSFKGGCVTRVSLVKLVQIKEPVTEALSKAFKNLKLSKQDIIVCIPRHLVTIRILEFPSTDPKEIANMVTLQVGKQTPYSREEIIFAYRLIHMGRQGYTKVMLVIARRSIVNARVEALQKAGIEVDRVTVSSEGVFNWFSIAYESKMKMEGDGIVLIDIDSNYADFIVIYKEQFSYTRNILIGTNHLLEDGEKWKEKFVEEVRHSIDLFHNEERDVKISQIFLGGAAKHVNDLPQAISHDLEIPVENVEPFNNIKIRNDVNIFNQADYIYVSPAPVLGMSIKNKEIFLDLTSSELRIQKEIEEKRKQITLMGVLIAAIVMVSSLILLITIYTKNFYLGELKKQITRIAKEANYVESMRKHISLVEERLSVQGRSINVLHEISQLTPTEIYFTNINIEEMKQTTLQGRADAMSNVFSFVTTLEGSPYFENVKTTYTTTKKEKGGEYTRFEIICMHEEEGVLEETDNL